MYVLNKKNTKITPYAIWMKIVSHGYWFYQWDISQLHTWLSPWGDASLHIMWEHFCWLAEYMYFVFLRKL